MAGTTLPLRQISDDVFVATDEIVSFGAAAVDFIRERAAASKRGRARICAHKSPDDRLHEMLIAMRSDTYICPHRHRDKVESFHLIDGSADIVLITDDGGVDDVIELGPGANLYYRLGVSRYHTVLINSPLLVIHEVTNGPFDPADSDFAKFSPPESADPACRASIESYVAALRSRVAQWKRANPNTRRGPASG